MGKEIKNTTTDVSLVNGGKIDVNKLNKTIEDKNKIIKNNIEILK